MGPAAARAGARSPRERAVWVRRRRMTETRDPPIQMSAPLRRSVHLRLLSEDGCMPPETQGYFSTMSRRDPGVLLHHEPSMRCGLTR
jgi:hypothetical protein